MSSFYDQASLVVIPSGYKTGKVYAQKPLTTDGQLSFTRSNDTATRVGPDGLIEKVRTNALLQSNTFDTTWANNGTTESNGHAGYDGTNNAWLVEKSIAGGSIRQSIVFNGVGTYSVYAKAGTLNHILLYLNYGTGTDTQTYFDLSSGSVGTTSAEIDANIESVGNGWYRCSVAFNTPSATSTVLFFPADADNDVSGTSGNIYIQDAQLEQGSVSTPYIETTTAAVSVGPVANVPRLDYSGGATCPSLLLEPQRTNLVIQSEYFNTYWSLGTISITNNYAISPEGVENASRYISPGGAYPQMAGAVSGLTIGQQYTTTFYVKSDGTSQIEQSFWVNATNEVRFTPTSEWTRITHNFTAAATSNTLLLFTNSGSAPASSYLLYGFQMEASAYPTSYIPTYGAAATRGADGCSKSGIGSLIGGTSGTVFFKIKTNKTLTNALYKQFFYYQSAAAEQAYMYINSGNVIITNPNFGSITSSVVMTADTTYKVAIAYANNDFKLYINGAEAGSSTSGTPIDAVAISDIGSYAGASEFNEMVFEQYLHFQTRLTNAQMAELTTL